MSHEHECTVCGVTWPCNDEEWKDLTDAAKCGIEQAAKVNHQGPFCHSCFHGILFIRHARHTNRNPTRLLKMLLIEEDDRGKVSAAGSEPQARLITSAGSGGIPEPAPNAGSKATPG